MLLIIAYSRAARTTVRNICRAHEDTVIRQFGRVAIFAATEFGAFQALRLREKHGDAIQVAHTRPFNEFDSVRDAVRRAASCYSDRETLAVPYDRFASGRDLPDSATMKDTSL